MKLESLIQAIPVKQISGNTNKEISGLDSDSRNIQQDFLFVAVKGTAVDGHQFIDKSIESDATAIVCEEMPENITPTSTYIQVSDSKEALGLLASEWYANPSRQLTLVGVTGTNGKTTIATLLYEMFRLFGEKAGLLSTVCKNSAVEV